MKKLFFAMFIAVSLIPLCSMAQGVKYDVHAGANLSGYVSGNHYTAQDRDMKVGAGLGVGISYETDNRFVISSGLDFLLVRGGFTAMSEYVSPTGGPFTTFPSVNTREISIQVPLKFGYDFHLGEKWHFVPAIGVYGRFSMISIKDNVTENTGEGTTTFKWNCFNSYQGSSRLSSYNRWDVGGLIEGKFTYLDRYSVSLGYNRGFLDKSSQFKFKNQGCHFTIGYTL